MNPPCTSKDESGTFNGSGRASGTGRLLTITTVGDDAAVSGQARLPATGQIVVASSLLTS